MIFLCEFDEKCDIQEVDQFGWVDLCDAYINHTIPADIQVDDLKFDECDNPANIIGKPGDIFDAINMGVSITNNPNSYVKEEE